jgi:hypothetical protein
VGGRNPCVACVGNEVQVVARAMQSTKLVSANKSDMQRFLGQVMDTHTRTRTHHSLEFQVAPNPMTHDMMKITNDNVNWASCKPDLTSGTRLPFLKNWSKESMITSGDGFIPAA